VAKLSVVLLFKARKAPPETSRHFVQPAFFGEKYYLNIEKLLLPDREAFSLSNPGLISLFFSFKKRNKLVQLVLNTA
jgi:hypothetical protein